MTALTQQQRELRQSCVLSDQEIADLTICLICNSRCAVPVMVVHVQTVGACGVRQRYCESCLAQWLRASASCPVCRKAVQTYHVQYSLLMSMDLLYPDKVECSECDEGFVGSRSELYQHYCRHSAV